MEVGTYETEAAGGEVYGQLLVKDVKSTCSYSWRTL